MVNSSRAAEFLLLDRLFPRSVFAALEQAEACLAELERSTVRDAARIGVAGEAHRIVGRARTMLEFMGTPELLAPAARAAGGAPADLLRGQRRRHPSLLHRAGPAGVGAGGGRVTPADAVARRTVGAGRGARRTAGGCRSCTARVPLQRAGPLLLQRGPADPGEQHPADDAALQGRDRAGRHRLRLPRLLGLPRSPPSTCTARTRSWRSPAPRSSRPARTWPGTTGSAGAPWPRREVRDAVR